LPPLLAALALTTACGSNSDVDAPPWVLELARQGVDDPTGSRLDLEINLERRVLETRGLSAGA
jgi:hypothetical protein